MAFIYKISNNINGKSYVGKTLSSIKERWKQHIKSKDKEECKNRPLYRAFNKYGVDNFTIQQLEECSEEVVNDSEIYWIRTLDTFKKGYNATKGGDGRVYADKALIKTLWDEGKTVGEIVAITKHDSGTVKVVLNSAGITKEERLTRSRLTYFAKPVLMFTKQGEYLKEFASTAEANKHLKIKGRGHISAVCDGKRKSCYGYVWKWK